jgi:hypothetical protein
MFVVKRSLSLFILPLLVWYAGIVPFQAVKTLPLKVDEPQNGEALQGIVLINGTTDVPGFRSVEIAFSYQNDSTSTWFLIDQSGTPVKDGLLASWDTSTITDGEYQLRVKVMLDNGQAIQESVTNLRVRNYTLVETSTPDAGTSVQEQPTLTKTPLADFRVTVSTPTPLPTNPVELTGQDLKSSAFFGAVLVFGALVIAGVYWGIRLVIRR